MGNKEHEETPGIIAGQSELERTLQAGIYGAPEWKRKEKSRYLGEFRERVLRMLTKSQVGDPGVYPEIEEDLKDPRASLMIIDGDISDHASDKYRKLALALHKPCTVRNDPDFEGDTGLVVVSREAVDAEQITVEGRTEKLRKRGLPEQLINAAGEAVCKDCYNKVLEAAPEEAKFYEIISAFSRLMGERCPGHE